MRLHHMATALAICSLGGAAATLALSLIASRVPPEDYHPPLPGGQSSPGVEQLRLSDAWPHLFGTVPVEEAELELAPDVPAAVPVVWQDYTLQGLVAMGPRRWAFLILDGRRYLIRPRDTLETGETVASIEPEGVWLEQHGERHLVEFNRDEPILTVELPSDDGEPEGAVDVVRMQGIDAPTLSDLLERARSLPGSGPASQ